MGTQEQVLHETEVLLVDPSEQIFTGMTADVDIEVAEHRDVLVLPSQAVLGREVDSLPIEIRDRLSEEDKSKTFATVVYRYIDGKAVITPVRIGASNATHTIVESGIAPGEKIVVGPFKELEKLAHDQAIKDERKPRPKTMPRRGGAPPVTSTMQRRPTPQRHQRRITGSSSRAASGVYKVGVGAHALTG